MKGSSSKLATCRAISHGLDDFAGMHFGGYALVQLASRVSLVCIQLSLA